MKLWHIHDWDKWSALVPTYRGHNTQFRACKSCGQIAFRDLGYCQGARHEDANAALADVSGEKK